MQKELQDYYENRFSMMTTKGWKDLIEDVEIMLSSVNHIGGIEDERQLYYKKGEMSILNWLKHLRDASSEVYEQLQEEGIDA
jgi:crotonobetainyl-CoA:carnitine CoA-transferase CaiB-like acyl-CoA transferase